MLGFEEAHKNRRSVVSATQAHLATIAKDVVGIPTPDAAKTVSFPSNRGGFG